MDPTLAPGPEPFPFPRPLPRPRPARRWLPAVLLAVTTLTLCWSGWLFWAGGQPLPERLLHFLDPRRLAAGLPFALAVIAILGTHEMGHWLACRRHGIPATLPFFIPGIPPAGTFGAVIRIRGIIPDRNALFDVAAAGPLAGFVVALPILAWGTLTAQPAPAGLAEEGTILFGNSLLTWLLEQAVGTHDLFANPLWGAGWFGMLVTSLNLFPVGQLDGGHAAYAVSPRLHRLASWATIGAVVALVLAGTWLRGEPSPYTVWCGILLLLRARHPRLMDEATPLSPGRRRLAWVLLLVFVLTFVPVPLTLL